MKSINVQTHNSLRQIASSLALWVRRRNFPLRSLQLLKRCIIAWESCRNFLFSTFSK